MKKFEEFNLSADTLAFIHKNGFTEPTPIQEQVIPYVLKGKDVIGLSKTGSGKSHAYLIPIMEKTDPLRHEVQAVVTAPTRELAVQIYEKAKVMKEIRPDLDIRLFTGGREKSRDLESLRHGQPQIVIGTPGRIKDLFLNEGQLRLDNRCFCRPDGRKSADACFLRHHAGSAQAVHPQIHAPSSDHPDGGKSTFQSGNSSRAGTVLPPYLCGNHPQHPARLSALCLPDFLQYP